MPKFYRVYQDDFKTLPFQSDMDEGLEDHALIIEEQSKDGFIAEQVGQFTRHLLSILHEAPTRGERYPFKRISKKYPRKHSKHFGNFVVCPVCHMELSEQGWNTDMEDLSPCCPLCEYEFEMEEEE